MGMIFALILFYLIVSVLIYSLLCRRKKVRSVTKYKKNILVVTAHPDDECIFFGPTILQLNATRNVVVHVLCLSAGDYYGEGQVRSKELLASCHILGIPQCNVAVVEHAKLQDDPDAFWDVDVAARLVLHHVKKFNAHTVVTFDDYGVSGHRNHVSCYRAVKRLVEDRKLPNTTKAYSLNSVSILRKFVSILDLPFSVLTASKLYISSPRDVYRSQLAMRAHGSQFVWFRILNIIFSRYVIVNTLDKINAKSK